MAPPLFFTIASMQYPGYNVVQRGSRVVLAKENLDNPYQLWYKDDSWRFLQDSKGNPAFALINNGSKAALKADSCAATQLSLHINCKLVEDASHTTLWTSIYDSKHGSMSISSMALNLTLGLGIGKSLPESGDGVVMILQTIAQNDNTNLWQFNEYVPSAYVIQSNWVSQILITKNPHEDVTFTSASGTFNDELTVVAVNTANRNDDQEVWYKVPARGRPEDSNSSFIVISKSNGKALKGSTKPGDKVITTEFDPFDDNFVWSENRMLSIGQAYVAINLANGDSTLQWFLPPDAQYQNAAYYHPLTLRQATTAQASQQWRFVPFSSS